MPQSVVFAYQDKNSITALPLKIPHPDRCIGTLRPIRSENYPVIDRFNEFIVSKFKKLRTMIRIQAKEMNVN